jgi:AcrR family transcriptional regulator
MFSDKDDLRTTFTMFPSSSPEPVRSETRARILQAARQIFGREGHAGFSMRKLATAMDCSVGTLYLYFESKQDVFQALANQSFDRLLQTLANLSDRHKNGDPVALLKKALYTYTQFGLQNSSDYRLALIACPTQSRPSSALAPVIGIIHSIVSRCVAEGHFRRMNVDTATQALWAAVHGVTSLPVAATGESIELVIDGAVGSLIAYKTLQAYGT